MQGNEILFLFYNHIINHRSCNCCQKHCEDQHNMKQGFIIIIVFIYAFVYCSLLSQRKKYVFLLMVLENWDRSKGFLTLII